jgi:hypothetical protein
MLHFGDFPRKSWMNSYFTKNLTTNTPVEWHMIPCSLVDHCRRYTKEPTVSIFTLFWSFGNVGNPSTDYMAPKHRRQKSSY